jgi:hypothetical protein
VEPTLAVLKVGQLSEGEVVREIADARDDFEASPVRPIYDD